MKVPFYEKGKKFGYYEFYVLRKEDKIIIYRINVLGFGGQIISDKIYDLDTIYCPILLKNKNPEDIFLSREEAYKIVNNYWEDTVINKYLGYLIIHKGIIEKELMRSKFKEVKDI